MKKIVLFLITKIKNGENWIIDSGTTSNMTNNQELQEVECRGVAKIKESMATKGNNGIWKP